MKNSTPILKTNSTDESFDTWFTRSGGSPPWGVTIPTRLRTSSPVPRAVILHELDERPKFIKDLLVATELPEDAVFRTVIDLVVNASVHLSPRGLVVAGGVRE